MSAYIEVSKLEVSKLGGIGMGEDMTQSHLVPESFLGCDVCGRPILVVGNRRRAVEDHMNLAHKDLSLHERQERVDSLMDQAFWETLFNRNAEV